MTVEKIKPKGTLTATPAVKARNGFHPTEVKSLKRVVSPIQRKVKIKDQLLRTVIGLSTLSVIEAAVFASDDAMITVVRIEATKKPMTNFGNRYQISPAWGF